MLATEMGFWKTAIGLLVIIFILGLIIGVQQGTYSIEGSLIETISNNLRP
jgi:uncharacterized membrane protein